MHNNFELKDWEIAVNWLKYEMNNLEEGDYESWTFKPPPPTYSYCKKIRNFPPLKDGSSVQENDKL